MNRLHDVRGQRSQLEHSSNVAAVDTIRFGDVLEVFELPRFQLLLPCVRFGQGSQQTATSEIALEGNRLVTIIGSGILTIVGRQSARHAVLSLPE